MVRLSISSSLIACLALAGLVNHATTCCCGDSLLLELIVASCGCDAHKHDRHAASHHPGPDGRDHTCYKSGSRAFLANSATDEIAGQDLDDPVGSVQVWFGPSAPLAVIESFVHRPSDRIVPARADRLGRWLL